nr:hypothetical protein [Microlunatus endophyticus]
MGAGFFVGAVERVEAGGYEVELAGEAVLLLFEQVQGQGSGVVGLEARPALVLDAIFLDGELVAFGLAGGVQRRELLIEHPEHGVAHIRGYLDRLVVVGDQLLHLVHEDRRAGAVRPLAVPPGADEVGVDVPAGAARVGDHQPGAARAAVDGALEVVVVAAASVPGAVVGGEDGLDAVPDLDRHDRRVRSGVGHALVGHVALVVGVGQHPMHR